MGVEDTVCYHEGYYHDNDMGADYENVGNSEAGIREDWMAEHKMRSYEMTEIVSRGLDECLSEAFAIVMDECDATFLSVDIDVVDPGHAPGTGTPEPGGLSARELLDAVRRVGLELPLAGVDVVEVSPPYDHADVTAALANRVVLEVLSAMARRRRGDAVVTTQPLLGGRDVDE